MEGLIKIKPPYQGALPSICKGRDGKIVRYIVFVDKVGTNRGTMATSIAVKSQLDRQALKLTIVVQKMPRFLVPIGSHAGRFRWPCRPSIGF